MPKPLNLSHTTAVAALALEGLDKGAKTATQLEAFVLEELQKLQGLTILEIRDMLQLILSGCRAARSMPAGSRAQVLENHLREGCR